MSILELEFVYFCVCVLLMTLKSKTKNVFIDAYIWVCYKELLSSSLFLKTKYQ